MYIPTFVITKRGTFLYVNREDDIRHFGEEMFYSQHLSQFVAVLDCPCRKDRVVYEYN